MMDNTNNVNGKNDTIKTIGINNDYVENPDLIVDSNTKSEQETQLSHNSGANEEFVWNLNSESDVHGDGVYSDNTDESYNEVYGDTTDKLGDGIYGRHRGNACDGVYGDNTNEHGDGVYSDNTDAYNDGVYSSSVNQYDNGVYGEIENDYGVNGEAYGATQNAHSDNAGSYGSNTYNTGDYTVNYSDGNNGSSSGFKNKKKKEPKYITRKAMVLSLVLCMVLTSALTIAGITYLPAITGSSPSGGNISATNYTLQKATGSEKSIQEIVAMNENAVVEIKTESVSTDMWMQNYVTEGAGSGVIIDTKGYILTCNHVVEGSRAIKVTLKNGKEYEATLVGADSGKDIAVLKIKANNLTAAAYGDSSQLAVGDLSVAIGNPLGELGGTASQGIISALDRQLTVEGKTLSLLQTDTSINPGNSGGGLFNQYGQLIGIVVAKSSGSDVEGLGFAIPINDAAKIAKEIIKTGNNVSSTPVIGVKVQGITDAQTAMQNNLKMTGVYIAEVTLESAREAGCQVGDLIYYVDDTKIETTDDLAAKLSQYKAGDKIDLTVIRENRTINLKVTLQKG